MRTFSRVIVVVSPDNRMLPEVPCKKPSHVAARNSKDAFADVDMELSKLTWLPLEREQEAAAGEEVVVQGMLR